MNRHVLLARPEAAGGAAGHLAEGPDKITAARIADALRDLIEALIRLPKQPHRLLDADSAPIFSGRYADRRREHTDEMVFRNLMQLRELVQTEHLIEVRF